MELPYHKALNYNVLCKDWCVFWQVVLLTESRTQL